jgi:hypothetical protein
MHYRWIYKLRIDKMAFGKYANSFVNGVHGAPGTGPEKSKHALGMRHGPSGTLAL